MDKKEIRKLVCGIIIVALLLGAAIYGMIALVGANVPAIALADGSKAYQDYILAAMFTRVTTDQKWFLFGSTALIYGGAILFIAGLITVIAKRSIRYIFLPIAGLIGFELAAFLLQVFYHVSQPEGAAYGQVNQTFVIVIATIFIVIAVLSFIAFILGMVFPRRLLSRKEDEPIAAPEEVAPAEEPIAEKEPEEETEEEPEDEPVVAAAEEPEVKEEAAPAEEPVSEEEPVKEEKPVAKKAKKAKDEPKEEPKEEPEEEKPVEEAPVEEAAPAEEEKEEESKKDLVPAPKTVPLTKSESKPKVVGKYEVFPEAGFFKYRLKANNGEILIVSNPYKTKDSAIAGIETLRKNIPLGNNKIIVDKNKFAQFRIFTGNDSRLIVAGEIYPSAAGAEKALTSVMNFYETDRIVTLDEIPEEEHREWNAFPDKVDPSANGKLAIEENEDGKFQVSLRANNGQLLFVTATYASKSSAKKAIENIKTKLLAGKNLTIAKDKQNRYQFVLYSDNGMCLLMGESYPKRESAESALRSARNFIADAKFVE